MSGKPTVIGGKLKLKGDPKAPPKKPTPASSSSSASSSSATKTGEKRQLEEVSPAEDKDQAHLTEAQRRFKQKKIEREQEEAKKLSAVSFRDRIEKFNEKLSKLTEHNDIPRVSAAGNG